MMIYDDIIGVQQCCHMSLFPIFFHPISFDLPSVLTTSIGPCQAQNNALVFLAQSLQQIAVAHVGPAWAALVGCQCAQSLLCEARKYFDTPANWITKYHPQDANSYLTLLRHFAVGNELPWPVPGGFADFGTDGRKAPSCYSLEAHEKLLWPQCGSWWNLVETLWVMNHESYNVMICHDMSWYVMMCRDMSIYVVITFFSHLFASLNYVRHCSTSLKKT